MFQFSLFPKKQTYKELRNVDACQRKPTELKRIHIEPVIKLDHFTVQWAKPGKSALGTRLGCWLSTLAFQ